MATMNVESGNIVWLCEPFWLDLDNPFGKQPLQQHLALDFLILRPLSSKTGYQFFEGGGVKSFRSEGSKQWGGISVSHHRRSNGNAADAKFSGGSSNPGRRTVGGGGGAIFARPGSNR